MKEFIIHCLRQNLSKQRIRKYELIFETCKKLKINLKKLRQRDIDKFFFWLNSQNYKEWTKLTKWRCFKKIAKFYNKDLNFSSYRLKEPKTKIDILTKEEIFQLIAAARNFRDKLLILLLYESGARISEILNLKKEDLEFDEFGAILNLNGKTGQRKIRIVKAAEFLKVYYKALTSNKLFELSEQRVNFMLKYLARKCGIKKRIYPHLFRHTRATHLAKFLTEPELKIYFGWSNSSKMPALYVHLSARDIDEKIISLNQKIEI